MVAALSENTAAVREPWRPEFSLEAVLRRGPIDMVLPELPEDFLAVYALNPRHFDVMSILAAAIGEANDPLVPSDAPRVFSLPFRP